MARPNNIRYRHQNPKWDALLQNSVQQNEMRLASGSHLLPVLILVPEVGRAGPLRAAFSKPDPARTE